MEKNEEEENYEKINKKQKKNIKKDTLKNALKEGLTGNQLKSDFYINLYNNKKYLKKNNKNRNNNEINKNNEIQTTSFKRKNKQFSKEAVTTNNIETKNTESVINNKTLSKNLGNMRLKNKNANYAYTDEELNGMDFNDAYHHDNRPFIRMYWSYLVNNHIILNAFFADTYLDLRIIKISFLIYTFEISFFLNAIFYTDKYISDTYQNEGVLDFVSSLPKSIYSVIVTMIAGNLLKMLSSSKYKLNKIIKERENKLDYLNSMNSELLKLRKKLIIYFIFVFVLGLFFLYYVSAFCAVYQNSQLFWFYGCLESMVIDLFTPFIISLLFAILRFISIKKQFKFFYVLANFLNIIL